MLEVLRAAYVKKSFCHNFSSMGRQFFELPATSRPAYQKSVLTQQSGGKSVPGQRAINEVSYYALLRFGDLISTLYVCMHIAFSFCNVLWQSM